MATDLKKTLTTVKGIGDAKAQSIIDSGFSTQEKLQKATVDDLTKIKGVTENNAKDILAHVKKTQTAKPAPKKKSTASPAKKESKKTTDTKKPAPAPKKEKTKEPEEDVEIVEEPEKKPKIKPTLSKETQEYLQKRKELKQRTPTFLREEWFRYKRVPKNWRRPDGITSKMRINLKYRPSVVRVGFRGPKKVRGLHPSGFEEIMVYTVNDLKQIDPKSQAARIGGTVGTRKRLEIIKKADERDIRVLNRGV